MTVEAVATPLGRFHVRVEGEAVTAITLPGSPPPDAGGAGEMAIMIAACEQLHEYATGKRQTIEIPVVLRGTDFQRRVWQALTAIPFGETRTYADIAQAIGKPGAARAVGSANRANPVPVVVPCHRVVASHGLGGYAGGPATGDGLKAQLLQLEGVPTDKLAGS